MYMQQLHGMLVQNAHQLMALLQQAVLIQYKYGAAG
jgi:hypothetical protein